MNTKNKWFFIEHTNSQTSTKFSVIQTSWSLFCRADVILSNRGKDVLKSSIPTPSTPGGRIMPLPSTLLNRSGHRCLPRLTIRRLVFLWTISLFSLYGLIFLIEDTTQKSGALEDKDAFHQQISNTKLSTQPGMNKIFWCFIWTWGYIWCNQQESRLAQSSSQRDSRQI